MTALREIAAACDESLAEYAVDDPGPGRFESERHGPDRAFVLETVYEGYLLHYAEPRVFHGMDADLRLLAGDALYALGLARLAELGDLDAVAELGDLISLCAWAHAEGRPELVEDLWAASVRSLSDGGGPGARAVAEGSLALGGAPT